MPTRQELYKELDWVTEKISSQIWTLNLGTLGTTWALLITSSIPEKFRLTFAEARWIFLASVCALLCEMGQYLSAYKMYRGIQARLEENNQDQYELDPCVY
jgi:hypothetical protein